MKSYLFFVALLLASSCDILETSNERSSLPKTKVSEWLYTLCSYDFAGRKTGSYGDSLAFNFLKDSIESFGYSYEVQRFNTPHDFVLRNIFVTIPGEDDSLLVIGAHYDGPLESEGVMHYPAANDNASGVVVNLALLDTLRRIHAEPKHTILVCFWDGEEVFDGSAFNGSGHFVSTCARKDDIILYLNYDSVGHEHGVLYVKNFPYSTSRRYMNYLFSNDRFNYVDVPLASPGDGSSDYVSFGRAGIPFLGFGDHNGDMCDARSHSMADMVEYLSLDRIDLHVLNTLDLIYL